MVNPSPDGDQSAKEAEKERAWPRGKRYAAALREKVFRPTQASGLLGEKTMEGLKDGAFRMKSLNLSDLVVSLSRVVRKLCPWIDLLICITQANEAPKSFELAVSLSAQLSCGLQDVCCFFDYQTSPDKWKVLTTHGSAEILSAGQGFEAGICHNHQSPRETLILRQLIDLRGKLLSGSLGLTKQIDIRYPTIKGHVLLCGDFSLWDTVGLLALHRIFMANGAQSTLFATPVIGRSHCHTLIQQGLKIARLHPPEDLMEQSLSGTMSSQPKEGLRAGV